MSTTPILTDLIQPATPELTRPVAAEIDRLVSGYEYAQQQSRAAAESLEQVRLQLIGLVTAHGTRPEGAEQSLRLSGHHNTVTVTRGTTLNVNEDAVRALEDWLDDHHYTFIDRLFRLQVSHKMGERCAEVVRSYALPKRDEEKVLSLYGRCIDPKPKAPTVKVEVIKPEKPARTPRAKKAVA
jgi:hypothetical protein